jgi:hypothetical protein
MKYLFHFVLNVKGNNWVLNDNELSKLVNLQESNYNNAFYINYGYNIKRLELTTNMHIFKGLVSVEEKENARINNLLNFENNVDAEERKLHLRKIIIDKIVSDLSFCG